MIITVHLDKMLEKHERSLYWRAKHAGVSYSTLWRLKKGKALGINFVTLEKLCETLDCQPGDLLKIKSQKQ
jgi:putative transcriptional regulator